MERGRTRSPEIQGLRGFAVLAVVGDHLLQRPSGGFVGVDVFFVISGFLITGLLLREHAVDGRIDLVRFYRRRIKRTAPAALAVVAVTVAISAVVLPPFRWAQLLQASGPAAGFWLNWQLIAQGTDYLHATDVPTPLQHFWSLAVEEQFYLVWPALIIAVAAFCTARNRRARPRMAAIVAGVGLTSMGWAALQTVVAPTSAYFSTGTRAWELAAGALAAIAAPVFRRAPGWSRNVLMSLGLSGLIASVLVIDPSSSFPMPWALLPVAGTLLVLAATCIRGSARFLPLDNVAARYVGEISYSLYLWHFPVIVLLSDYVRPSKGAHALELLVMLALAVLSYTFVERPFRDAAWRATARSVILQREILREGRRARRGTLAPLPVIAVTVLCLASGCLVGFGHAGASAATAASAPTPSVLPAQLYQRPDDTEGIARAAALESALSATRWPEGVRAEAGRGDAMLAPEWIERHCLWRQAGSDDFDATAKRCSIGAGDARRTAVVLGDSIAISYLPALERALDLDVWRIVVLTAEQCPAIALPVVRDDGSGYPECSAFQAWSASRVAGLRPDLLLMASSYSAMWRWHPPTRVGSPADAWTEATTRTVRRLSRSTGRIVILDAPPTGPALRNCITAVNQPTACTSTVSTPYENTVLAQRAGVARAGVANVEYPSTLSWYCTSTGRCPAFAGSAELLADGMHPATGDAPALAALLRRSIQGS